MDRMKAIRRWQLNLKATAVVSSDHFLWEAAELSALRLLCAAAAAAGLAAVWAHLISWRRRLPHGLLTEVTFFELDLLAMQ